MFCHHCGKPLDQFEGELAAIRELIEASEEKILTALTDLQTADTNLQAVVAKVLADFATALTNAAGDPAAIESVVTDMNNMAAQLTAADPETATASTPPASSSGTTAAPAAG